MAKLVEVLTQLSDLDPNAEYSVEVKDGQISVEHLGKDQTQVPDNNPAVPPKDTPAKNESGAELLKQIQELKEANRALLMRTPTEEKEKSFEEIAYSMFGKTRGRSNAANGSESDLHNGQ